MSPSMASQVTPLPGTATLGTGFWEGTSGGQTRPDPEQRPSSAGASLTAAPQKEASPRSSSEGAVPASFAKESIPLSCCSEMGPAPPPHGSSWDTLSIATTGIERGSTSELF